MNEKDQDQSPPPLDQPVIHAKLFQMVSIAYRLEATYTRHHRTAPAQAMKRVIEEIKDLLNEIELANPNFIVSGLNDQELS